MTNEDKSKQAFDLQTGFGPVMGNEDLMKILGFKTMFAFRAAIKRNTVGIDTFNIKGRRGKFAYTRDVENWLSSLNHAPANNNAD